jgi:hypothetical protein
MNNKIMKNNSEWVDNILDSIPEHSSMLSNNLRLLRDFTYLDDLDFNACAMIAAIMSNNGPLAQEIEYNSVLIENEIYREMVKKAVSTVSMVSMYDKSIELMHQKGHSLDKVFLIENSYPVILFNKFYLYLFCASILGNSRLTFSECYSKVMSVGIDTNQLHDVIKLVSVVSSINKVAI